MKWPWGGKALPIVLGGLACLVVLGFYPRFFETWLIDPPLAGLRLVLSTVSGAFRGSTGLWGRYVALVDARKENAFLRDKIVGLERSLDRYKAMGDQNRQLMSLLELKSRLSQKSIACHVIADNPTTAPRTLLLDCGSKDGVKMRDGVVGRRGVVGYVIRVFARFSQVLWGEDPMFALPGRLLEAGQKGLVRGRGVGHTLKLQYVAALVPVEKGSDIVTSGEDGFFPPNEPIGRVVKSEDSKQQMFRTVRLESAERINSLWVVFVLVPPHGWTDKTLLGRQGS